VVWIEGWSKKGLGSSFLGISACFYDPHGNVARHVTLDLIQMCHPHTGKMLAEALQSSVIV